MNYQSTSRSNLELLRTLLEEKAGEALMTYPLSQGQQALWFIHKSRPESSAYNIAFALKIDADIDPHALGDAFQNVVNRHDVFRTVFKETDGLPVQVVKGYQKVEIDRINARGLTDDALLKAVAASYRKPFNLDTDTLVRASLFTRSDRSHVLLFTAHHIIIDFQSFMLLHQEFWDTYRCRTQPSHPCPGPLADIQYRAYVDRQNEFLASPEAERQAAYWKQRLSGDLPVITLPEDFARPSVQTFNGDSASFFIDAALTRELRQGAAETGVTLYTLLLSAFQIFLHIYTGQDDILIGTPTNGRSAQGFEKMVGYLVNMLVMRKQFEGDQTVAGIVRGTRSEILDALKAQEYPFPKLVDDLVPKRDPSRSPVFQVTFELLNFYFFQKTARLQDLSDQFSPYHIPQQEGQFDMMLTLIDMGDTITGHFNFNTELFKRDTVSRMTDHFKNLLGRLNPDARVADLNLLSDDEIHDITVHFNRTDADNAPDKCVHQLFEEQAEKNPSNVAISANGKSVTYDGLNKRSNRLAHALRKRGIGTEDIVAIRMDRSVGCIAAILGVLKSGAAYLPVDPDYSDDRVAYMLEDSRASVMITRREMDPIDAFTGKILYMTEDAFADEPDTNPDCHIRPGNLAYLIYTSGSTGKPKGALIEHKGVVNYILWAIGHYGGQGGSRLDFPFYSSISFDLTVTSIFAPLLSGNRIYVYPEGGFTLGDILREDRVDIVKLTPSHLRALLNEECAPRKLHDFIIGGEELEVSLARKVDEKFGGRVLLHNEYGPTETVVGCMIHTYDRIRDTDRTVPIGIPSDNVRLYIMDAFGRLVPDGVVGELYIGGTGVCRGYLNRPDLTREKFLSNPFVKNDRLYRSGDLVKRENGRIAYIGRADHQVKLRGYRIECGEVENKLLQMDGITDAVVLLKKDRNNEPVLCAYYVSPLETPCHRIRQFLGSKLPNYMIPGKFMRLKAMPLNKNGKIDRHQLEKDALPVNRIDDHIPPRTDLEKELAQIWKTVLNLPGDIGVHDNFFNLGGNSLYAIQVSQKLRPLGFDCRSDLLLKYPTIAELSRLISPSSENPASQKMPVQEKISAACSAIGSAAASTAAIAVGLTPIQKWFFEHFDDPSHYNQFMVLTPKKSLVPDLLERAFQHLLRHHAILRARYTFRENQWVQQITPFEPVSVVSVYDLTTVSDPEADISLIVNRHHEKFDLSRPPLLFAAYFMLPGQTCRLVICVHHLVADVLSLDIILQDLVNAYGQLEAGNPVSLPEVPTPFEDWAVRRHVPDDALVRAVQYWTAERFSNLPSILPDHPDPWAVSREPHRTAFPLLFDTDTTQRILDDLPRHFSARDHDIILAGVATALHQWSGIPKIVIEFDAHGRTSAEPDVNPVRTVGWLNTKHPVLLEKTNGRTTPAEQIAAVRSELGKVPENTSAYGILKYLGQDNRFREHDRPQIAFNYLGKGKMGSNPLMSLEEISLSSGSGNGLPYLLTITCVILDGRLNMVLTYADSAIPESRIIDLSDRIRQAFQDMLNDLPTKAAAGARVCRTCVLPDTFPNTDFDRNHTCQYCRNHTGEPAHEENEFASETELVSSLDKYRHINPRYDALVPLSGGVDSSNALIDIVEKFKLRVLGFHNDHGYEDKTATENVRKLCQKLEVDLIVQQHDKPFMKKLWRYTNASNVSGLSTCFVCGGILYANAVAMADRFGIPLIINGYSKGQAMMMADKKDAMNYWEEMIEVFKKDEAFFKEFMDRQAPMSRQRVYLSKKDLEADVDRNRILIIPFYIFKFYKTDKTVLKERCKAKFGWREMQASYPERTTNCDMVWLNTYMDLKRIKYTMYHEEYANLVRTGEISREQAMKDLEFNPPKGMIERLSREIGLTITKMER